jgi:hypothetical protein
MSLAVWDGQRKEAHMTLRYLSYFAGALTLLGIAACGGSSPTIVTPPPATPSEHEPTTVEVPEGEGETEVEVDDDGDEKEVEIDHDD